MKQNFRRILGWLCISAVFWIAGGLAEGHTRLALWAIAVLCEYVSPMFGFRLPVLGRSDSSSEWTIEGHHLAERCQLFVIVALGETILITGATLSEMESWSLPVLIASLVAFLGSLAMWWVYFDTSSKAGSHAISQAENPGQLGAYFHYVHVALVGAIIVCAVANELVIAIPTAASNTPRRRCCCSARRFICSPTRCINGWCIAASRCRTWLGCWCWRYWPPPPI